MNVRMTNSAHPDYVERPGIIIVVRFNALCCGTNRTERASLDVPNPNMILEKFFGSDFILVVFSPICISDSPLFFVRSPIQPPSVSFFLWVLRSPSGLVFSSAFSLFFDSPIGRKDGHGLTSMPSSRSRFVR